MCLYDITLNYLSKYLISCEPKLHGTTDDEIRASIRACQQYFLRAHHLMNDIQKPAQPFNSPSLTLAFLPFNIQSGTLTLYFTNGILVMKWIVDKLLFDDEILIKVHTLDVQNFKQFYEEIDYDVVKNFFARLAGLRKIILNEMSNDTVIGYITTYCRDLEHLDCHDDNSCSITDKSLKALSTLKKLKFIYFSMYDDEFEEEDELDMHISTQAVADLFKSLPELKAFQCPEYILRNTFIEWKEANNEDNTLELEWFQEACPKTIAAALPVCRNLKIIRAVVFSNNDFIALQSFLKNIPLLSNLSINFQGFCRDVMFNSVGLKLVVLNVIKSSVTIRDILLIDSQCPKLNQLAIADCDDFSSLSQVDWLQLGLLFPSLKKFSYNLRNKQALLLFLHPDSCLQSLSVQASDESSIVRDIFMDMKSRECMWNLENLALYSVHCNLELYKTLLACFPKLKRLSVDCISSEDLAITRIWNQRKIELVFV